MGCSQSSGYNYRGALTDVPVLASSASDGKQQTPEPLADESQNVLVVIDNAPCAPEALRLAVQEVKEPPAGHVRVRVEAASVAFTDTLLRRGMYAESPKTPFSPGYDFVGTVDALADDVTDFKLGEKVGDLAVWGGNARYVYWPATQLLRVPLELDSSQATAVMLSYVTAYQQIHRVGELKEGQSCLIVGGSGAVGDAVLQLCQVAGIQCFATGSERHHARFKSFGAMPLPRSAKDWLPLVTGKMDLVIDGVCEDGFDSSYAARNATGKLSAMGLSHPIAANLGTWYIVKKFIGAKINSRSTFYSIGDYRKANPVEFQQDLTAVYDLILQSKITPDIKKIVNFAQVSALHADMEVGKLVGKYVLDPWLIQTAAAAPSAPVAE